MNIKLENLDLQDFLHILRKHVVLIAIVTVLAGLLTFLGSKFFITPKYQAKTSLIVNSTQQVSENNLSDQLTAYQKLVNDYTYIIKSRTVLDQVRINLDLTSMTTEQLQKEISITVPDETDILVLTVTDKNRVLAQNIAEQIDSIAPSVIMDKMTSTISVGIFEKVLADKKPVSPNNPKNALIGLFLGIVGSIAFVFLREFFDHTFRSDDEIGEILNLSVLGVIPYVENKKK